jgi:hypothetical protein
MKKIKIFLNKLVKIILVFLIFFVINYLSFSIGQYIEMKKIEPIINEIQGRFQSVEIKEKKDILNTIMSVCNEYGIDWKQAVLIAGCESRLNTYFVGLNKDGSYDRGIFALNSRYYSQYGDDCAFNIDCSARVYAKAVLKGRQGDFLCANKLGLK